MNITMSDSNSKLRKEYPFLFLISVAGDVRFWDPRFTESVRTLETIGNAAAFEVHQQAKVFAT